MLIIDDIINELGRKGELENILLDVSRSELIVPWPLLISAHPWSIDLREVCADIRGYFSVNWVDKGVRNHIEQEALCKVGDA